MRIDILSQIITKKEGLKKQVSIAQIKEILRCLNDYLDGELYKMIRKL